MFDRSCGLNPDIIDRGADRVGSALATDISNLLDAKEPRAKLRALGKTAAGEGGNLGYEAVIDLV